MSTALQGRPSRVGIVEDDSGVRRALERLLRSASYEVSSFATGEECLSWLTSEQPDCLLVDLELPGIDGLALQQALVERQDPIGVVFLSGNGTIRTTAEAIKSGAVDFLEKPVRDGQLFDALSAAIARSAEKRAEYEERKQLRASFDNLTTREREVFSGVVAGQLNKQIAGWLGITEGTVKVHRAQVMRKMGADSLAELVRMASRLSPEYSIRS